ncbi:hypothetical protein QTG56_22405 (plasmid) [Rossellomorea sp. AcN35-11]|nr:hypothetical protein [Rossellomorea aquimaris]WJV32126.1 hypothetical protein QTG56_22405 [Rossellomorea sp. AcN35-11]
MSTNGVLTPENVWFLKDMGFSWVDSLSLWTSEVEVYEKLKIRSFVDPDGEMGTAVIKGIGREIVIERYFIFNEYHFYSVYKEMRNLIEGYVCAQEVVNVN